MRPEHRLLYETYIVLHKLMIIAALLLLPLLAWHHAMTQIVENYGMPRMWEEDFREEQLSRWKIWVWVLIWILVSVVSLCWELLLMSDVGPSGSSTCHLVVGMVSRDTASADEKYDERSGRQSYGESAYNERGWSDPAKIRSKHSYLQTHISPP